MKRISALLVAGVLAVSLSGTAACSITTKHPTPGPTVYVTVSPGGNVGAQFAFRAQQRRLWFDHVAYTRMAIVEYFSEAQPNSRFNATAARLLQNQVDIGDSIKPFYGDLNGARLTALLKGHIGGAVAILVAAKANNGPATTAAISAWRVNGNQVADFLSSLDPQRWPQQAMRDYMQVHLSQTINEATAELGGKYVDSLRDYDMAQSHAAGMMADIIALGIINKFPNRF